MGKREEAMALHANGYNCAQAVACAFAKEVGADSNQFFDIAAGFGLGGGTMEGVCGALSAATMVAGQANSEGAGIVHGDKRPTRKLAAEIQKGFKERAGAIICKEIKGIDTGKVLCPCPECVGIAAELTEKVLGLTE